MHTYIKCAYIYIHTSLLQTTVAMSSFSCCDRSGDNLTNRGGLFFKESLTTRSYKMIEHYMQVNIHHFNIKLWVDRSGDSLTNRGGLFLKNL